MCMSGCQIACEAISRFLCRILLSVSSDSIGHTLSEARYSAGSNFACQGGRSLLFLDGVVFWTNMFRYERPRNVSIRGNATCMACEQHTDIHMLVKPYNSILRSFSLAFKAQDALLVAASNALVSATTAQQPSHRDTCS